MSQMAAHIQIFFQCLQFFFIIYIKNATHAKHTHSYKEKLQIADATCASKCFITFSGVTATMKSIVKDKPPIRLSNDNRFYEMLTQFPNLLFATGFECQKTAQNTTGKKYRRIKRLIFAFQKFP